jgi:regulator of replication initiation timing
MDEIVKVVTAQIQKDIQTRIQTHLDDNATLKAENEMLKERIEKGETLIQAFNNGNNKFREENSELKKKLEAFTNMESLIKAINSIVPATAAAAAPAAAPAKNRIIVKRKSLGKKRPDSAHIALPVKERPKLHGFCNFTDEEIREIRRLRAATGKDRLTNAQLSERYGTDMTAISSICNGKTYKWVK